MKLNFQKIKNYFLIPINKENLYEFRLENLKINLHRGRIITAVLTLMEVIIIAASLIYHGRAQVSGSDMRYYVMYIVLLVACVMFYIVMTVMEKNPRVGKRSEVLTYGFVLFILAWNMLIAVFDTQVTVYLIALMAISIIPVLSPISTLLIFYFVHMGYFILIPFFSDSQSAVFSMYTNGTIAVVIAWLAGYLIFRSRVNSFISNKELEGKTAELEKVNAELNAANKKLDYLSKTDGLTGLYNRRMFDKVSGDYWLECEECGKELAVIMIDIDHFKIYNDTYGHIKGDDCLQKIVASLKEVIPESSMAARYGGEEFAILVKGCGSNGATELAEKIRSRVSGLRIAHRNSPVKPHVTLSLGVYCANPKEKSTVVKFIARADEALYQAKEGGRDMVVVAE